MVVIQMDLSSAIDIPFIFQSNSCLAMLPLVASYKSSGILLHGKFCMQEDFNIHYQRYSDSRCQNSPVCGAAPMHKEKRGKALLKVTCARIDGAARRR